MNATYADQLSSGFLFTFCFRPPTDAISWDLNLEANLEQEIQICISEHDAEMIWEVIMEVAKMV